VKKRGRPKKKGGKSPFRARWISEREERAKRIGSGPRVVGFDHKKEEGEKRVRGVIKI